MNITFMIYLLILGLALIVKGGDLFVDAATWFAEVSGIPQFIIGATVVSLATTMPEMIVSFLAAADGKVDMAMGNAVGSVTANIGLIMSFAIICIPITVDRGEFMIKSFLMLGSAIVITLFGWAGQIGAIPGVILLLMFVIAAFNNINSARVSTRAGGGTATNFKDRVYGAVPSGGAAVLTMNSRASSLVAARPDTGVILKNAAKFIAGAAAIIVGSDLLVDNGSRLAAYIGVSERVIGVTVVAIGTSLPELVTTMTAISKKQGQLSIGNIIGANIIDLSLIPPVCALISGQALPISSQLAGVDLPACLIVCSIAIIPTLITKRFTRIQGIVLIAVYIGYMIVTTGRA